MPEMKNDHDEILRILSSENSSLEEIIFDNEVPNPDIIGKFISAMANSTAQNDREFELLILGVNPQTGNIEGSKFEPDSLTLEGKSLLSWLKDLLNFEVDFDFTSLDLDGSNLVILEVLKPQNFPVTFKNRQYDLINGIPIEAIPNTDLGSRENKQSFVQEVEYSENNKSEINIKSLQELLHSVDYQTYFDLLDESIPNNESDIAETLQKAGIIGFEPSKDGYFLTDLGALALSKNLSNEPNMRRRHLILNRYDGNNRGGNCQKTVFESGYLTSIDSAIEAIRKLTKLPDPISGEPDSLPSPYPTRALKELIVNALVHQDFDPSNKAYGSPLVEVFDGRIEISNTADLQINIATIVNSTRSIRNQDLYGLFAKLGLCEHKEHGWELIIDGCEQSQMPAPNIDGVSVGSLSECANSAKEEAKTNADDAASERVNESSNPSVAALSLVGATEEPSLNAETTKVEAGTKDAIAPGDRIFAPAPKLQVDALANADGSRFCVIVRQPTSFRNMSEDEKMEAAYWHACTLFAKGDALSNISLRERFSLGKSQTAQVSRLLRSCVEAGLLRAIDENAPLKLMRYVPAWA